MRLFCLLGRFLASSSLSRLRLLLCFFAETEATRRARTFRLLQRRILHASTQSYLQMRIDYVLVVADAEVLHDILQNSLSRRTASFLQTAQRLMHHLAVLRMINRMLFCSSLTTSRLLLCRRGLCLWHDANRSSHGLTGRDSSSVRHVQLDSDAITTTM